MKKFILLASALLLSGCEKLPDGEYTIKQTTQEWELYRMENNYNILVCSIHLEIIPTPNDFISYCIWEIEKGKTLFREREQQYKINAIEAAQYHNEYKNGKILRSH